MNSLDVIRTFEPRIGGFGKLCVAGGAVRDELMGRTPKDFDLFLLWPGEFQFKKIKEELTAKLGGLAINKPVVEWHKSEPFLIADVKIDGADVQILVNPAETVEALVQSFDWNVCLFARTESKVVQMTAIDEISSGKSLRLNKVTFPLSTLRRGFRFSERFKMKFERSDVLFLARNIIANAEKKNEVSATGNEPDAPALAANALIDDSDLQFT